MLFHPVHYYYSAGDRLWSIFSTLLFIAVVAFAIMLLVRAFSGPRHGMPSWYGPAGGPGTPAEPAGMTTRAAADPAAQRGQGEPFGAARILAERYARGEISEQEFRERADVLRQTVTAWRAADAQDHAAPQPSQDHPSQDQPSQRQSPQHQPSPDQPSQRQPPHEQQPAEHPLPSEPQPPRPRPPSAD